MSSNIDDWLASLGLNEVSQEPQEIHDEVPGSSISAVAVAVPEAVVVEEEPELVQSSEPISAEDFNAILEENGFEEPGFDEAEEVTDESEGVEEEEEASTLTMEDYENSQYNSQAADAAMHQISEERDLDAEEDADWNEAIASGGIVPVPQERSQESEVSEDSMEAFEIATADVPAPEPEPLIPQNSPTLLLNDTTSRFSGTEWYNEIQKSRIILAGCGGIGSWTVLQLARMNPAALFMYDDDIVEAANMSGQLYCQEDIGKPKVDAMADMIRSYTAMRNIYAIKDKFTDSCEAGDIMICGFDNMVARKTFFQSWAAHIENMTPEQKAKCIFLDGRLSIDTLQVFCLTGDDYYNQTRYVHDYLFNDSEADATQCSLKQTTYLACMIGSVIVNLFTNWVANTLNPIIPYDLPFFTEYDAQNMIFKTVK